jgi:predicted nucleotidyltransferase
LERVIEERRREAERALKSVRRFASCVKRRLGRVAVVVFGSYARGDFNAWSDIDVFIVVDKDLPRNPLERLNLLEECIREEPLIEPMIMTVKEAMQNLAKHNPLIIDVVRNGIVIIDDLNIIEKMRETFKVHKRKTFESYDRKY